MDADNCKIPRIMAISSGLTFLSIHPFVRATVADKLKGVIIGAALGLYWAVHRVLIKAAFFRSLPIARFQLVDPTTPFKIDGHRNKFTAKSWTDDTDHALLIILSYLNHNGQALPHDFAKRLRTWAEQGLRCLDRLPLGLGRTVDRVVFDKAYLHDPTVAAYKYWVSSGFDAASNGSLMRTHPLGIICIQKSNEETFRIATEFSVVTHADPRCVLACCVSASLIRGILRGEVQTENDVDSIIDDAFEWVHAWQKRGRIFEANSILVTEDEWAVASIKEVGGGEEFFIKSEPMLDRKELYRHTKAKTFRELQLDDSMRMAYVYKSLGAAVAALRLAIQNDSDEAYVNEQILASNVFEKLITEIVMEGGDADTNACIAGAFLGAWLGFKALPAHWRDGINHHDWLTNKCEALSRTIGVTDHLPEYKGSQDIDTMDDGGKGFLSREALESREMALMEMYLKKRADNCLAESKIKWWKMKSFSK